MPLTNELVHYSLQEQFATIRIDDGKRNALSPEVLREIYQALDRAEADKATVILSGRESVFSAGFDLKVMNRGGAKALRMLRLGYALTARVLAYPYPVIAACNGHVMAMGVFLMLSADYVIGSRGDFKISANEVALGLTMPRVAAAMLQHRLTPAAFQRAVTSFQAQNPRIANSKNTIQYSARSCGCCPPGLTPRSATLEPHPVSLPRYSQFFANQVGQLLLTKTGQRPPVDEILGRRADFHGYGVILVLLHASHNFH
jgi:enoyl-CoA hydratase